MPLLISPTLDQGNLVPSNSAAAPCIKKEAPPAEITPINSERPTAPPVPTASVEPPHSSPPPKRQRTRLGKKKGKKTPPGRGDGFKKASPSSEQCFKVAINSLISPKIDVALTAKFRSSELTLADADEILKMLPMLRELGHVSRFLHLAGYIANSVVLVLAAGTEAYVRLREKLCSGVSSHTTTDYQKVAIHLMRKVIKDSATGQELFAQVEGLSSENETIWVTQTAQILNKDRNWAAKVSIRSCLEYLVSKNLTTDKALREHLNLAVRGLPGTKKIKPKEMETKLRVADDQQKQEIIKTFKEKTPSLAAELPTTDHPLEPTNTTPKPQPTAPENPKTTSVENGQSAAESETIWHTYLSALPNIFADSPKETRAQKVQELFAVFKKISGLTPA